MKHEAVTNDHGELIKSLTVADKSLTEQQILYYNFEGNIILFTPHNLYIVFIVKYFCTSGTFESMDLVL